jgi:hypothetical protein
VTHARRCLAPLLVVALAVPSTPCRLARADAAADKQLALDLFDKGNKKLEEGRCDQPPITNRDACVEARDLFRRAYEIYPPGLGALRNLAYVELGLGMLASAARSFRELERKAPDDPNPKRRVWAEFAHKELETLEPRVPHVVLAVPADRPATLKITLDGVGIPEAAWGTSLDVDPGRHEVKADTGACPAFVLPLEVAEKETRTVDVLSCAPTPAPAPRPNLFATRVPPLVVMGVGGAAVVVGLAFGASALSKKQDACGDSDVCSPKGLEEARAAARTSTVFTIVGLAVAGAGAAWYFLRPPRAEQAHAMHVTPWAAPSGFGLAATGSF